MILIVDDDPVFLDDATTLAVEPNRTLVAPGSSTALELIRKLGSDINLVMIDLSFGSESGFDLIQAIKALDKDLPVIAFSGMASPTALESAMVFGANATLRKPISQNWIDTIARVRRRSDKQPAPSS